MFSLCGGRNSKLMINTFRKLQQSVVRTRIRGASGLFSSSSKLPMQFEAAIFSLSQELDRKQSVIERMNKELAELSIALTAKAHDVLSKENEIKILGEEIKLLKQNLEEVRRQNEILTDVKKMWIQKKEILFQEKEILIQEKDSMEIRLKKMEIRFETWEEELKKRNQRFMLHDLNLLFRYYFADGIVGNWNQFFNEVSEKLGQFEECKISEEEYREFIETQNNRLGLDVLQLIRLIRERHEDAHSDIRSAEDQRSFLIECQKTDFSPELRQLVDVMLDRLKGVQLKRRRV